MKTGCWNNRALGAAVAIVTIVLLAGCGRHENQWETATGSPNQAKVQAASFKPSGNAASDKQVRGCLSGSAELFTLVEENTATVYRVTAPEEPEAKPHSREVWEMLKQNAGAMVKLDGERKAEAGKGAPDFEVKSVERVADECPANLMGATNELNRTPAMKVGLKQVAPREDTLGSMNRTKPPVAAQPVNPGH